MAKVFFDTPRTLTGSTDQRLQALYSDLYAMSEKLNQALMDISIDQMTAEAQTTIRTAAEAQKSNTAEVESLKSVIIKSAEIVQSSMDEIRTELQSQYTAISEQFGEYQQTIDTQISATAQGILQDYHIEERIQAVETETGEFINGINAYIYSGILDPNDQTKVGIAIGYNVTNSDGTLNQANKMATFTADRLSFWVNQVEAAYFSNSVFHIANGEVTDTMRMGSFIWKVLPGGAMGLMKG